MSSLARENIIGILVVSVSLTLFCFMIYLAGTGKDKRDLYVTCLTMDTEDNCIKAIYPDRWQEELAKQAQVLKLLKKAK